MVVFHRPGLPSKTYYDPRPDGGGERGKWQFGPFSRMFTVQESSWSEESLYLRGVGVKGLPLSTSLFGAPAEEITGLK